MDENLGAALNSILSDPEQMAKLQNLAGQLLGEGSFGGEEAGRTDENLNGSGTAFFSPEKLLPGLMERFRQPEGEENRNRVLLQAMTPYLRESRREKLEKALRLSRVLRVAGGFMKNGGGDLLGL